MSQREGSAYGVRMVVWVESGVVFDRDYTARNTVDGKEEEVLACNGSVVGSRCCEDDRRIRDCIAVGTGARTASPVDSCTVAVLVNFLRAVGSVAVETLCNYARAAVEVVLGGRDRHDPVMANILSPQLLV